MTKRLDATSDNGFIFTKIDKDLNIKEKKIIDNNRKDNIPCGPAMMSQGNPPGGLRIFWLNIW